jgi:hypothetical protein
MMAEPTGVGTPRLCSDRRPKRVADQQRDDDRDEHDARVLEQENHRNDRQHGERHALNADWCVDHDRRRLVGRPLGWRQRITRGMQHYNLDRCKSAAEVGVGSWQLAIGGWLGSW